MAVRKMLNLDQELINRARLAAKSITGEVQKMIDEHTTTSTERTVLRLFGIDGVDENEVPLPNVVVAKIHEAGKLGRGAAYWVANAMVQENLSAQQVAEKVAAGELDITNLPAADPDAVRRTIDELARKMCDRITANRKKREELIAKYPMGPQPWIYVIVATGNIFEDVIQAQAAAKEGADIVAVIRSTAQSLLDYVPYGATTEGFGGTFATQENFRIMRKGLDEAMEEDGHYTMLVNYCSGLCMPEIAAMGAIERCDMMLNDAIYGILFRDINPTRTFVDQYFSRIINGYAGIIINTGEDNYLTTDDAYENGHTVLASQFINEQFALLAGLKEEQMGLGHAFEMDPSIKNGFLYEIAQAQMSREIFPNSPLKYMPPTKYMTGNIFRGHIQDAMFNMAAIMTNQGIQLLGMLTEAIHTPFLQDRFLAIENAKYIFNNARDLGNDIEFKDGGIVKTRAAEVLKKATEMLEEIETIGLIAAIERGMFANVKRPATGGKGRDGQLRKDPDYYNPFIGMMLGK
jgi:beta-lysine 5,6-aminomutase alpha subunit